MYYSSEAMHCINLKRMDKIDALITLITEENKRVNQKIDNVHTDVRQQNSRVYKLEESHQIMKQQLEQQQSQCHRRFKSLEVHEGVTRFFNWIGRHSKVSIIAGIFAFMLVDSIIHQAMAEDWITQLIDLLKKVL